MTYSPKRRSLLRNALLASATMPLLSISRVIAQAQAGARIILLGTQGGPNYNLNRGETASMLVVDDVPYLVDCGYGTMAAMTEAGINFLDLPHIFLTHLHDDHVADIPALLSHQWTQGRVAPTVVHGPYGTDDLVTAALQFSTANTAIRFIDEQRSLDPATVFHGEVVPATQSIHTVFEDERVKVTSIENTHFPDWAKEQMPYRALSYRFDTEDRSVVFSGDTTYSENLVTLARGADVLVCEVMEVPRTREWFDQMTAAGGYQDGREGIWNHIVETHVTTEDAGRMAAQAGVRTLVLNHVIPGGLLDLPDEAYLEGVRRFYDGEAIVGRDQMVL